jgi:hypothetical protein
LFYAIRFQNTGTDTAYEVHIVDTIDMNLDLSSLRIIGTSHPMILEATSDGILDFQFRNIMLPDSFVDEPNSHGYIHYTINHLPGLSEGTPIENQAFIYFDQNSPVITNQTLNTMVSMIPVSISDPEFSDDIKIYPNPFNDKITVVSKNSVNYKLTVMDIQGRQLIYSELTGNHSDINLNSLTSGVYLYKLINPESGHSINGKLIKR